MFKENFFPKLKDHFNRWKEPYKFMACAFFLFILLALFIIIIPLIRPAGYKIYNININYLEIFLIFLSAIALASFLFIMVKTSLLRAVLIALICLPALYFSCVGNTQLLISDETTMLPMMLAPFNDTNPYFSGYYGAPSLRTSGMLISVPCEIIKKIGHLPDEKLLMAFKAVHWFEGFLLLLGILFVFNRLMNHKKRPEILFVIVFIYAFLLVPGNIATFKIANYDLFTMTFSILTLLFTALSFKEKKTLFAALAVVAGTLAAQEKINGSYFLIIALIGMTVLQLLKSDSDYKNKFTRFANRYLLGFFIYLAVSFVSYFLIWGFKQGFVNLLEYSFCWSGAINNSLLTFDGIVRSLTGKTLYPGGNNYLNTWDVFHWWHRSHLFTILWFAVILVLSKVIFYLRNYLKKAGSVSLYKLNRVIFFIGLFLGTVYLIIPSTFWAFLPKLINSPLRAPEMFVYATPVSLMIFLIIITATTFRSKRTAFFPENTLDYIFLLDIVLFAAFFISLSNSTHLSSTLFVPHIIRYANFFSIILILYALSAFNTVLLDKTMHRLVLQALSILLCFGLSAEAALCQPIGLSFRPFWYNYIDFTKATDPVNGLGYNPPPELRNKPHWNAWGEEYYVVGKYLEKKYGNRTNVLTVYQGFIGKWMEPSSNIVNVNAYSDKSIWSTIPYKANTWYVINRHHATTKDMIFPKDIKPEMTMDFLGYPYLWVYSAEELNKHRFQFIRK